MSEPQEDDDAPPPNSAPTPSGKPRYEGPFKKAADRKAEAEREKVEHKSRWLAPWRLYGLGMLGGLILAGFYAMKLTVTPEMVRAGAEEKPEPAPPPKPVVRAYCLALSGSGAANPIEPSPFCTEARPPACKDGDALQLTYATNGATPKFAYAAMVTPPSLVHTTLAESLAVRAGAGDTPLGQWPVKVAKERAALGVVAFFSNEPISAADAAPFFESWKKGVRLLARPPELPPELAAKGAELIAFSICVGK